MTTISRGTIPTIILSLLFIRFIQTQTYIFIKILLKLLFQYMAKRVRKFWPNPTRKIPDPNPFFWPKTKTGWPVTWPMFFAGQLDSTCNPNHFLKLFFLVKKKKLRQYRFNCLLRALRKQLRHLHNCMQINWKMNGWAFCNE